MFKRCLFCHRPFRENGEFHHFPVGRRIAFDPDKGRLWAICDGCHRWNLCPLEERAAAIYELERMARDRGHMVAHTANVTLIQTETLTFVRVGHADLAEQAWWRYGKELQRRKRSYESPLSKATTLTYGALNYVGAAVGIADFDIKLVWDDTPVADLLRWRRFGWAAWTGRQRCLFCGSILRALRFDVSWWTYPVWNEGGPMSLGVPCPRCDPWTPEKVYTLEGGEAENVLRRVLAYQHITGGSETLIKNAAQQIQAAGSAGEFTRRAGSGQQSLYRLGHTSTMALEIALNENVEQRLMDMEVRALEFMWKKEEDLARIIDEELSPRHIFERHMRKMPPRLAAKLGQTFPSVVGASEEGGED